MHDFDDSFSDDFDDDSGDDGDSFSDDFGPEDSCDDSLSDEIQGDSGHEDDGIDIGWEDMAIIGGMAEEFAEEEKERLRIEREMDKDEGQDYL